MIEKIAFLLGFGFSCIVSAGFEKPGTARFDPAQDKTWKLVWSDEFVSAERNCPNFAEISCPAFAAGQ